jgi:hypothetical protein
LERNLKLEFKRSINKKISRKTAWDVNFEKRNMPQLNVKNNEYPF